MSNTALIHGPLPETNYLYKNVVVKGNFPLASLLVHPDTKYTIKHNFDLEGQTIELPPNCILAIDGGMIYNGTLVGNDSILIDVNKLGNVLDNVIQTGTWKKQDVLNSLSIGTVISGDEPQVTITGEDGDAILNFVLPKGDKGDKGDIGNPFTYEDFTLEQLEGLVGPQGPLGKAFEYSDFTQELLESIRGPLGILGPKGVSILSFTKIGELGNDLIYNTTFDDGSVQTVNIPKGEKGDQGPMGDVAVITPLQQSAFTMYSTTGQNSNGPMTQKAVTDSLTSENISYNNILSNLTAENVQGALDEISELAKKSGNTLSLELTYDMADRTIPYHISDGGAWETNNYHQAFFKVKKRDVIVITKGTNMAMFALLASIDTSVAPVFMTGYSNRVSITTSTPKTIVVPEDGWLFVYGWNTRHDTNYWPASVVKKWGGMDKVADFGVNNNNTFSEIPLPELIGYTRIDKAGLFYTTTTSTFGVRVYDVSAYHGKRIKMGGVLYKNECWFSVGTTANFNNASEITRVGYFVGENSYTTAHFWEDEIVLGDNENYIAIGSYFGADNKSGYVPYVKVMIPADEAIDNSQEEMGYPHLVTENIHVDLSTRTKVVSSETGLIIPGPSGSITYYVTEIPISKDIFEISFSGIIFSNNYGYAYIDENDDIVSGVKTTSNSITIKQGAIQAAITRGAVKLRITSSGINNPIVVKSYPKPIDDLYNKVDTTNNKIIGHDFGDYKPLIGSKTLYIPQSIDTSEITSEEYNIFKRGTTRSAELLDNLYGLYDALAAAHPQFFKEVVEDPVRKDQSSTYDIRRYRLGFLYPIANANRSGVGTNQYDESATGLHKRRRLLFEMGIHAAEDMAMLGGYLAIKAILESNEPWAVFIKSNFVIDILPCSNPYGFVHNNSRNVNKVNLNRTFYDNTSVDEEDDNVRLQRLAENNHIINIIQELKPLGLIGCISPHNTSNGSNDNCGYFVSRKSYKYWDYYVMLSQNISASEFHLFKSVFGGNRNNYFHCWDTTGESDAKGQMHMYVDGEGLLGCTFEILRLADDSVEMTKKKAMLTKITAINIIQAFGSYY